jgi:hypothetical protein
MEDLIKKLLEKFKTDNFKKPLSLLEMLYRQVRDKELVQSKMLAGLLSPEENHGHGSELVESFLHHPFINVDIKLQKDSNLKVETERGVKLKTERTEEKGSIDIFISWFGSDKKNHAVIIENKLHNAKDQLNQLNKYYKAIVDEDYKVDRIVYMPISKEWKKSKYTDTEKDILLKTVDFDAHDIVDWLEKLIKEDPKFTNGVVNQYKDFLDCLISNQYIMLKAIEIQEKLSIEEIEKLEKLARIVNSKEWSEARVKPITDELKKHFPNMEIKGHSYIMDDSEYNNYVELFFKPFDFWVELWICHENIHLFLCSHKDAENVTKADVLFTKWSRPRYSYYKNEKMFKFGITDTNSIVEVLTPILQKLSEYKG